MGGVPLDSHENWEVSAPEIRSSENPTVGSISNLRVGRLPGLQVCVTHPEKGGRGWGLWLGGSETGNNNNNNNNNEERDFCCQQDIQNKRPYKNPDISRFLGKD